MAKLKITQVKSQIDRPRKQKETLRALGLRKLHQSVEHDETPQIRGMVQAVEHLIQVEKIS